MKKILILAVLMVLPALAAHSQGSGSGSDPNTNIGAGSETSGSSMDTSAQRDKVRGECTEKGWGIFKRKDCPPPAASSGSETGSTMEDRTRSINATGGTSGSSVTPKPEGY